MLKVQNCKRKALSLRGLRVFQFQTSGTDTAVTDVLVVGIALHDTSISFPGFGDISKMYVLSL